MNFCKLVVNSSQDECFIFIRFFKAQSETFDETSLRSVQQPVYNLMVLIVQALDRNPKCMKPHSKTR